MTVSRDHDLEVAREAQWRRALDVTRGNLVNREGRAAGYPERAFFEGGRPVWRYASEELVDFFKDSTERRLTAAVWAEMTRPPVPEGHSRTGRQLPTAEDAEAARALRAAGVTYDDIAETLNATSPALNLTSACAWRLVKGTAKITGAVDVEPAVELDAETLAAWA